MDKETRPEETEKKLDSSSLLVERDQAIKQLEGLKSLMHFSSILARSAVKLRSKTEQMKSMRALLREKYQIQKYLDAASVVLLVLDRAGNILLVNRKGRELFGREKEDILGRNWFTSFLSEKDAASAEGIFAGLMRGEKPAAETFETTITGNASDRAMVWRHALLVDDDGAISGLILSGEDVTDRKLLEAKLLQAQKMEAVGRLAGGIAHDFNNLIGVILGYTSFVLETAGDNESLKADLVEIKKAGERAATLTRQLLAFSRKQPLQPRALRLDALVADMDKFLKRIIGEDIKLSTSAEPQLCYVQADPGQIEQVIMNLAVNARDAMPQGGTLTISAANASLTEAQCRYQPEARPGNYVKLTISDTGLGMSQEVLTHVFEPFFTTKETGKGTGLGLSTVYGIIKQHDGFILVSSAAGKGTQFSIHLPVFSFDEASNSGLAPLEEEQVRGGGEGILLVEDEEGVRRFAARTLRKYGYTVIEAATAGEGVRLLQRNPAAADLLFTDMVLPDNTGIYLIERLEEIKPGLKVVVSSGYVDEKSQWPIVQKKGLPFLSKPYSAGDLLRTVRRTLGASAPGRGIPGVF